MMQHVSVQDVWRPPRTGAQEGTSQDKEVHSTIIIGEKAAAEPAIAASAIIFGVVAMVDLWG